MAKTPRKNPPKPPVPENDIFLKALSEYRGSNFRIEDLLDKRSERTTFNLSSEAIEAINWLSKHSGTQIKDVFDHVLERCVANLTGNENDWGDEEAIYNKLTKDRDNPKTRKTYVISRGTLRKLNKLSISLEIARDVIMENSVIDFFEYIKKSTKIRNEKYQIVLDKFFELESISTELLHNTEPIFSDEDRITELIWDVIAAIRTATYELKNAIDNDVPLNLSYASLIGHVDL
jgi:hypothetical protein